MLRYVFQRLGYRRVEWKCDSRNEPSGRAAQRLGFTYEGRFRQHVIVRGGNRDTDWYSMLDTEWPAIRARNERWLDPSNFDQNGHQLQRLEEIQLAGSNMGASFAYFLRVSCPMGLMSV